MRLRSPTVNESKQFPGHDFASVVIPVHAGIQICSRRISLDTRPRFREGMLSNRGYDGPQPLPRQLLSFRTVLSKSYEERELAVATIKLLRVLRVSFAIWVRAVLWGDLKNISLLRMSFWGEAEESAF